MGGNCIKGVKRLPREKYFELEEEVCEILNEEMNFEVQEILAYFEKESYGDMDLLIKSDYLPKDWKKKIIERFKPTGTYQSGPKSAFSFDYKKFQIDLIPTTEEDWNFAANYFSYNDRGNLIGRLAHGLGLKFGHDGLWLPVNNPQNETERLGEICLTKNPYHAEEFLGVPNHFTFDYLEDIFRNITSSRFFAKDRYPLEHRSHKARIRDKKRKTYMDFLKWLDKNQPADNHVFNKDKSSYLPMIFEAFPMAKVEYDRLMASAVRREAFRAIWNGETISDITKLKGKELGQFIAEMTKKFESKEQLEEWVLTNERLKVGYTKTFIFRQFFGFNPD